MLVVSGPPSGRLRCHQTILRLASPLLDDLLECSALDAPDGSGATKTTSQLDEGGHISHQAKQLPTLSVDGSAEAWTEILAHLYAAFSPPRSTGPSRSSLFQIPPNSTSPSGPTAAAASTASGAALPAAATSGEFSWTGARLILPVLHQYDFRSLMMRLLQWVTGHSMSADPSSPSYIIEWLDLAEGLQLDGLTEHCHAQLSSLPLSLSPSSPNFLPSWLLLADARGLTQLQDRCLRYEENANDA